MAKIKIKRPESGQERPKIALVKPQKHGKNAPDFDTLFEWDGGDPLEAVEYDEDDPEGSADAEMTELVRQIKAEKRAQYDRFRVGRDPRYYVVVCFQSHDQMEEAVQKLGWDVRWGRFVNGLDVCRQLGVDVAPIELEPLPQRGKPHLYSREEVL